jgi:hypothetical protein
MNTPHCEVHGQFHVCDKCVEDYHAEARIKYDATKCQSGPSEWLHTWPGLEEEAKGLLASRTPFLLLAGSGSLDIGPTAILSAGFTKEHALLLKAALETHFGV